MAAGKKKKTRNLLLLVLLLVVLVGAYVAIRFLPGKEQEDSADAEGEKEESTVLVDMDSDNIVRIEYRGPGSSMALVYEEDTWYREDDRDFPVNQAYATSMRSVMAGLSSTKTINASPDSLADYGLEDTQAQVWVKVTNTDGNSEEIRVGLKSPSGSGYYVAVGDSQMVYLASTSILTSFQYTENQMIAKHSTPSITAENITKILIEKPDGNVELSYEPGNDMDTTGYNPWLIRQGFPDVLPGNSDTIGVLVDNYTSFTLGDCVDYKGEELAQYGLEEPAAVLSLVYYEEEGTGETDEETGDAITEQKFYNFGLKVGSSNGEGQYYIQLEGADSVYLMEEDDINPMIDVEAYNYVSRLPGLVNIAQVDKITVEYGTKRHEMSLVRTREAVESDGDDLQDTEETEEVTTYFLDGTEVEKSDFTTPYQKMIGVTIDGLVDEAVSEQASLEPLLTLTYDRTSAGLKPVVTSFYEYNDNFNRISVNGLSYFRVNIRDVESLITMFEELFAVN